MKPKPPTTQEIEVRHVYDACGLTIELTPHKRSRLHQRLAATWGKGDRGQWAPELGICKVCGCEIDSTPASATFAGEPIAFPSTTCDECMELAREHYNPELQQVDEAATSTPLWDAKCPERHKQVTLGEVRPGRIDWPAYERVIAWTPNDGRGLILTGLPGTGKTSAFWTLARNLERDGSGPITLGSVELGRVLADAAKDIREVGWLYRCRVLMVDDLGKERASPGVAALLWEVLDRRLSANLPVILTTNFDGKTLAARFSEEHLGDSIRRRISELCRQVQFGRGHEQPKEKAA